MIVAERGPQKALSTASTHHVVSADDIIMIMMMVGIQQFSASLHLPLTFRGAYGDPHTSAMARVYAYML